MNETWAPLMASIVIPFLGVFISYQNSRQDPGAIRKMRRHAQLLEILPVGAQPALETLLTSEVEQYAARQSRKYERKIDRNTVAALVVIGIVLGLALFFIFQWALIWAPAWIIFGIVALVGLTFMGVGSGQLFKANDEPSEQHSE